MWTCWVEPVTVEHLAVRFGTGLDLALGDPDRSEHEDDLAPSDLAGLVEAEGLLPALDGVGGGVGELVVDGEDRGVGEPQRHEVLLQLADVGPVVDAVGEVPVHRSGPVEQDRPARAVGLPQLLAPLDHLAHGGQSRHHAAVPGDREAVAVAEASVDLLGLDEVAPFDRGGLPRRRDRRGVGGAGAVAPAHGEHATGRHQEQSGRAGDHRSPAHVSSPPPRRTSVRKPGMSPRQASSAAWKSGSSGSMAPPGPPWIVAPPSSLNCGSGMSMPCVAHALREGQHLLLHLRPLLGVVHAERAPHVAEEVLARLLGRFEVLLVEAVVAADPDRAAHPAAVLVELRVGHVDAVLAHALGEGQHGLLALRLGDRAVVVRAPPSPAVSAAAVVDVLPSREATSPLAPLPPPPQAESTTMAAMPRRAPHDRVSFHMGAEDGGAALKAT